VESLSQSRDKHYRNFLDKSASVYHPAGFESSSSASTPLSAATTSVFATISTFTTAAASAISTFSANSSHSVENNTTTASDDASKSSPLTDPSAAGNTPSTAAPVNAFLSTSRAAATNVASTAATTATAATGWFAKQLSTVRMSMTKPQDPPSDQSISPPIEEGSPSKTAAESSEPVNAETVVTDLPEETASSTPAAPEFTLHDDSSEGEHRPSEGDLEEVATTTAHDQEEHHASPSKETKSSGGRAGKKGKGKH
jgi:hypothetical protein